MTETRTTADVLDETCGTCRFGVMGTMGDPKYGLCHRYPPREPSLWPEVSADDWCGEYRAIAAEQARAQEGRS